MSGVCLLRLLRFGRQVDVEAALVERQGGHEDDEEHEQHVDHRRDVHVRVGLRDLALEDAFGAVVLMGSHYSPPCVVPLRCGSVMSPMSSMPLARSSSIASITALYSTSSSALMMTMLVRLVLEDLVDPALQVVLRHLHGVEVEPSCSASIARTVWSCVSGFSVRVGRHRQRDG